MRLALIGFLVLAAILCEAQTPRGVVVESVASASGASTAAMRPGELLLSWSRGNSRGQIESPFNLFAIEREQVPVGTVTMSGRSGSQEHDWQLGAEDWGITARPEFSPRDQNSFLRAKHLVRQGNVAQARIAWRSIASRNPRERWLYAWCAFDGASELSQRRRWTSANALYSEALANTKQDPRARVFILHSWAIALEQPGKWNQVHRMLQDSVLTAAELGNDTLLVASLLDDLGAVAYWQRDTATAKQSYVRALDIQRQLAPESLVSVRSLRGLAMLALGRGDQSTAESLLREGETIIDTTAPSGLDAATLKGSFANLAQRRGDLAAATRYWAEAQAILEPRWNDSVELGRVLTSRALILIQQGDLLKAETFLRRASAIYEARPVDPPLGVNLMNELGMLAYESGDFETASKYARRTDDILKKLAPSGLERAGCLMNLGLDAIQNGELDAAEGYLTRSLEIMEKVVPNTPEDAKLLVLLGELSRKQGNFTKFAQYTRRSEAILTHLGVQGVDIADLMQQLALVARHEGNLHDSEDYYRRAIDITNNFSPGSGQQADILAGFADLLTQERKPELAATEYQLAINALESQMSRLGGADTTRSDFRARHDVVYQNYIDVLIGLGRRERAFELAESSRARTLLETLSEAKVDIRNRLSPEFLQAEQKLREEFSLESDHRVRLLEEQHSDDQIKAADAKIAELLSRFSDLESQVRAQNPPYAELTQPKTTSVQDVQQKLLDPDSLLLEYSLGEKHSYVWLVSENAVTVHQLPGRVQIERLARRAYQQFSSPQALRVSAGQSAAAALARAVLGPVADQLGGKRLLIVPDGALEYIPFATLPMRDGLTKKETLLISRHEIVTLPSASVLMTLRKAYVGRQPAERELAVLADPVFDASDPRVKRPRVNTSSTAGVFVSEQSDAASRSIDLTKRRWTRDLGMSRTNIIAFPRLTYSRREAQAIAATVPRGQSLEALDFKASRAEALNPQLAKYKILHFATHGVLDTKHPEFSGLLFSLVDEEGAPQIGLLSLEDVYNLNLPVDLVVLSACETALGKDVNGEGIIGLTRGFMYAGASRVVASLWKVNDVATSQLMVDFYRAMEKDHLAPAAALRQAQLEIRKNPKWAAPYYWAGFQLQGEWK